MTAITIVIVPALRAAEGSLSWIDYASITLAVLAFATSAVLGLLNRRTAKRALAISERQEARQESRIDLYLVDSRAWRRAEKRERLLGFEVRVSNPSDRPNSLVEAELHVTYRIDDTPMTVKLRPDPAEQVEAQTPPVVRLDLPATLEANSARSGWFLFRVHDELTAPGPIDRYELVVHDVHGTERELQVTVLKQS